MEYIINLSWDNKDSMWTATSNDIPSFVLKSSSIHTLLEHTRATFQELLTLNSSIQGPISFTFVSEPQIIFLQQPNINACLPTHFKFLLKSIRVFLFPCRYFFNWHSSMYHKTLKIYELNIIPFSLNEFSAFHAVHQEIFFLISSTRSAITCSF